MALPSTFKPTKNHALNTVKAEAAGACRSVASMGAGLISPDLMDVLSTSVCGWLSPADIQALGRTCKALHRLVTEQLPAETWRSVAARELPPDHPTLSLSDTENQGHLEREARLKQSLPAPAVIGESSSDILSLQQASPQKIIIFRSPACEQFAAGP